MVDIITVPEAEQRNATLCRNRLILALPVLEPSMSLSRVAALVLSGLASFNAAAQVTYQDLRPLFQDLCVVCHSGPGASLGLSLDSYQGVMAGSGRGPVVKPGQPGESELLHRLRGKNQPRMPLTGPPWVPDQDIARVARWIEAGAPEGSASGSAAAEPEAAGLAPVAGRSGENFGQVAPILLQRCARCHSDNGIMGRPPEGLRLAGWEQVVGSGERAAVVPGSPRASELWRRVTGIARPRMPFDGPPYLDDDEIALLERWIAAGAPGPDGRKAPMPTGAEVRLHGRLTGRWSLDGLPLDVSGASIRKDPRVGDYVEVRGHVGRDGSIRVERLRPR